MSIEKFSVEKVLSVQRWASNLFSFTMTRPAHFKFTAGQFVRLGVNPSQLKYYQQQTEANGDVAESVSLHATAA